MKDSIIYNLEPSTFCNSRHIVVVDVLKYSTFCNCRHFVAVGVFESMFCSSPHFAAVNVLYHRRFFIRRLDNRRFVSIPDFMCILFIVRPFKLHIYILDIEIIRFGGKEKYQAPKPIIWIIRFTSQTAARHETSFTIIFVWKGKCEGKHRHKLDIYIWSISI